MQGAELISRRGGSRASSLGREMLDTSANWLALENERNMLQ